MRSWWRRLIVAQPIVTRLVISVALTMSAVLFASGAFVFWRVGYALNRQLDQDLRAYQEFVESAVRGGTAEPADTPGQSYQIYSPRGRVIGGNATVRLVSTDAVATIAAGGSSVRDVGDLFPPAPHPYRVVIARVDTPDGPVIVASAISKVKHDEALRELLLQLTIAGFATLLAASYVGYRTARAALNPVESYRRAVEEADPEALPVLPVSTDHDDELTRLGHTLNALLQRIAGANERERQFLSDASHELRSPLTLMRTELEWLRLRPRTVEESTTSLASLSGQVERLIDLSNALLDLEEVRATRGLPEDAVDLAALVEEVSSAHQRSAASQDRRIEARVSPGAVVTGDSRWLAVALDNLVSNALRHGAGTVTVAVSGTDQGVALSVSDQGSGFPEDFVGKAFDRFARADQSRSTPGSGLGLALVRAVADAHGASASVSGATVSIDFAAPPSAEAT